MKKLTRRFVLGSGATALGVWLVRPGYRFELRPVGEESPRRMPHPDRSPLPGQPGGTTAAEVVPDPVTAPPPWKALAPYGPGDEVAESWTVHALTGVQAGSSVVTLRHASGEEVHLRLMRRGIVPIGVAQTAQLDLLLMNHARGGMDTDESLARVVRGFAAVIDDHAKSRPAPSLVLASLEAPPSHYC